MHSKIDLVVAVKIKDGDTTDFEDETEGDDNSSEY
jgi:hypothetical protein